MSDQAELQAKIAALRGRINQRKQSDLNRAGGRPFAQPNHRGNARWTPFGRGGGRHVQQPFRNRVLVLGGVQQTEEPENDEPAAATATANAAVPPTPAKPAFVTAQAAGRKQIMTQDAFLREQQQRQQRQAGANPQVVAKPPIARPPKPAKLAVPQPRELDIDGIRFHVQAGGSKLIRVADSAPATKETPKKTKIADVEFLRTKHGNLIRASIAKGTERRSQVPQCENFTRHGTNSYHHPHTGYAMAKTPGGPRRIRHAGTCSFGPACRFTHDPTKVAICKDFLRTGTCKAGRNCDLSHEATYHRVPACTHFLRGNCTNDACRYPHVNVSPAASVCRPFATLGYCAKGADCDKRHVYECPDYANHGHCANREKNACSLPHIDRAGTLRKAAQRQAKTGSEDESDVSSSDDDDGDDEIDSDVEEDIVMDDDSHELSQQQDFIAFS